MQTAICLLLVVFFLLMNAFFVIAEFALVRVRKSQIDMAVAEKRRGAEAARDVTTHINASRPSPPFWKHRFWPGASPRRRCTPSAWPWAFSS